LLLAKPGELIGSALLFDRAITKVRLVMIVGLLGLREILSEDATDSGPVKTGLLSFDGR
jgi:hypothetical protein